MAPVFLPCREGEPPCEPFRCVWINTHRSDGQLNRSGRKSNPRTHRQPAEGVQNQPRGSADLRFRPLGLQPKSFAPLGSERVWTANTPRHLIHTSRPAKPKPAQRERGPPCRLSTFSPPLSRPRAAGPLCPLHWARIRKPAPRWAANALGPNTSPRHPPHRHRAIDQSATPTKPLKI